MKLAIAALLALTSSQLVWADAKDYYFRRFRDGQAAQKLGVLFPSIPEDLAATTEDSLDQVLNHDDPSDLRTFKQRYYINRGYAVGANPPVVLYVCGEAICEARELGGAVAAQAKKLGAVMVALEHRYYGKSVPLGRLTAENLKYLTIGAALKDLAKFQQYASDRLGLKGKWITIGGSYPGMLSAFFRQKFPTLTVGSLASSAPVLAKDNFEEYDLHVTQQAGTACAAQMRNVTALVEKALADPARHDALKRQFDAERVKDDDDFLYLVADVGAAAVQYGMKDRFCRAISAGGDSIANYADFAKQLFAAFGMSAYQFSIASAESEDPADYYTGFGYRSWLWQSCTEFGGFQNAWHEAGVTTRSTRINPDYHRRLCARLFGEAYGKGPDVAATNHAFYEPLLNSETASNILFTNGSQDPWSKLGITTENGNTGNPNTRFFGIEGAAHCDDLRAPSIGDSAALVQARALFSDLATQWVAK
jgi:hypothetical protein